MDIKNFRKKVLGGDNSDKKDLAFEIGRTVERARMLKGITQKDLAEIIKTKQPSIARVESGSSLPSLGFLEKIAHALNTHLVVEFGFSSAQPQEVIYKSEVRRNSFQSRELIISPYMSGGIVDARVDSRGKSQVINQ